MALIYSDQRVFHVNCTLKSPLEAASDGACGEDMDLWLEFALQSRGAWEAQGGSPGTPSLCWFLSVLIKFPLTGLSPGFLSPELAG